MQPINQTNFYAQGFDSSLKPGALGQDSAIISKAVVTEIKASNVNITSQSTKDAIANAAQEIQKFVHSMGRNLNFSIDEVTGYHVVQVVNPDTGELVRQLPSEELLKISREFQRLNNALVSQKA